MPPPLTTIATLQIEGWRQFQKIRLTLHPRLTVITGANGAGKSTILSIIFRHFGWQRTYLATPMVTKGGTIQYVTGLFRRLVRRAEENRTSQTKVGSITYSGGNEANLVLPNVAGVQYQVSIENMQGLPGIHIDSHRPAPHYETVTQIPTSAVTAQAASNNYESEVRQSYGGGQSRPIFRIKEALISMATFGEGNSVVQGNTNILHAYEGFVSVLRKVLPKSLEFTGLSIRMPEVVLVTKSGDFVIDAASGGIMTLIDITWRLYLFSLDKDHFIVTIDEPENHLHPSMQRELMGSLIEAFPKAQFIVATHSPFIVSAVRDSAVYALTYVPSDDLAPSARSALDSRVVSQDLNLVEKAGTAADILRNVLGVPVTMPIWAEEEIERISENFNINTVTAEDIALLRGQLAQAGLGEYYPEALARMARQQ